LTYFLIAYFKYENTNFFFTIFFTYTEYRNLTLAKFAENFYIITLGDILAQRQKGQIQPRLYKKGLMKTSESKKFVKIFWAAFFI
jgi:hypothetical protein